jgi:hypothetical protein
MFALTKSVSNDVNDNLNRRSIILARESFLLAFGIASFVGLHSDLNYQAILFPTMEIPEGDDDNVVIHSEDIGRELDAQKESGTTTPPLHLTYSETSIDTPVNKKMIAIESELEKDVLTLQETLGSKSKDIIKLQSDLEKSKMERKAEKEEAAETKRLLMISLRRIE